MAADTLDIREVEPRERHPLIFSTWDSLQAGESFELVNDHDPLPLYYQFQATKPEEFTWEYKESGPDVWRVELGKPGS